MKTMEKLEEEITQWLKLEGLNEINIAVIIKYMQLANSIGKTEGLDLMSEAFHEQLIQSKQLQQLKQNQTKK